MARKKEELQFIIDHLSDKGAEKLLKYMRKDFADENSGLHVDSVSQQSELLRAFYKYSCEYGRIEHVDGDKMIDNFLALNFG